ncbi:hypothetical protein COHA_003141 [Chlorella ohadii]|uniref:PsbP C-terminal domain-containing protein n=1 Tax=Chlorella ohadii TaxID=2649997 RepID=A0AAD5H849_9CHLO|nr:hypothetical protein COHA_003141 [Chlorella ohadii]
MQQPLQQLQQQAPGSRRAVLGLGAALLAAQIAPARAEEPAPAPLPQQPALPPMKVLRDDTLAYEFEYPAETAAGKPLPLLLSRKPERYSSAAPLTADARQRIVCELADLIDAVTVSVTVGPPSGILKGRTPDQWTARQVAEQVLIDRSTARITTGQRVSLNSVEEASRQERDGLPYFVFEHVSQGSPTLRTATLETYRHALAVTAVRPGLDGSPYLYTLNMSCPQELWGDLEAAFQRGVDSFRLLPPSSKYVAPDQDPWRFF